MLGVTYAARGELFDLNMPIPFLGMPRRPPKMMPKFAKPVNAILSSRSCQVAVNFASLGIIFTPLRITFKCELVTRTWYVASNTRVPDSMVSCAKMILILKRSGLVLKPRAAYV